MNFKVSIEDIFGCITYKSQNITDTICISHETLSAVFVACAPYYIVVEANDKILYKESIMENPGNQLVNS